MLAGLPSVDYVSVFVTSFQCSTLEDIALIINLCQSFDCINHRNLLIDTIIIYCEVNVSSLYVSKRCSVFRQCVCLSNFQTGCIMCLLTGCPLIYRLSCCLISNRQLCAFDFLTASVLFGDFNLFVNDCFCLILSVIGNCECVIRSLNESFRNNCLFHSVCLTSSESIDKVMITSLCCPLVYHRTVFCENAQLCAVYISTAHINLQHLNTLVGDCVFLIFLLSVFISTRYGEWNVSSCYIAIRSCYFVDCVALAFFKAVDLMVGAIRCPLINNIAVFINNCHISANDFFAASINL